MTHQPPYKRRIKIIKPRFQLKLVGIFVGLSALCVLLQSVLLAHRLTELSTQVPVGGQYVVDALPGLISEIMIFAFGLVLPLIFAVGVMVTHRIAGPVYRFEQHLSAVARGEDTGPCRIRAGDELTELCELINRAVEHLREAGADVESIERAAPAASPSASPTASEQKPLRNAG